MLKQEQKHSVPNRGRFELITDQSMKQPDIMSQVTGYSIDFKIMISESLKEFQSRTAPIIQEIAPGIKSISSQPPLKKRVLLLWNCCRNMTDAKLNEHRTLKDMESKAIIHFFDKILMTKKNILLLPVYFSTVDKSISAQSNYIFEELSSSTDYIYKYRQQYCAGYDTYIIYVAKTTNNKQPSFIVAQFTKNGLKCIDKIPMLSLVSTTKLLSENTFLIIISIFQKGRKML